jgi:hypothetical protein
MAHRFTFTVTVEVDRESGKFAPRDEIADELIAWIENADEGGISGIGADGDSEYTVTSWDVEETITERKKAR